jgi:hypothetical protein
VWWLQDIDVDGRLEALLARLAHGAVGGVGIRKKVFRSHVAMLVIVGGLLDDRPRLSRPRLNVRSDDVTGVGYDASGGLGAIFSLRFIFCSSGISTFAFGFVIVAVIGARVALERCPELGERVHVGVGHQIKVVVSLRRGERGKYSKRARGGSGHWPAPR